MPTNTPKAKILDACIAGAKAAARKYLRWSGGRSLRAAPESFTQVYVAERLAGVIPAVTLEEQVKDIINLSNAERRGRIPGKKNGRVDIVLWHKSGRPRIIVEVKRLSDHGGATRDIHRIKMLVDRCPSVQAGIVVAVSHAKSEATLARRFREAASRSESRAARIEIRRQGKNKRGEPVYVGVACFFTKGRCA